MSDKPKVVPVIHKLDNLTTLYVDGVEVNRRNDGMHFIRFLADLPEGTFEQFRIIIDKERLRKIIDAMCENSDYYPTKPVGPEKTKTKK